MYVINNNNTYNINKYKKVVGMEKKEYSYQTLKNGSWVEVKVLDSEEEAKRLFYANRYGIHRVVIREIMIFEAPLLEPSYYYG